MLKFNKYRKYLIFCVLNLLLGFSTLALASGFQLYESNVTNLGNAYAGAGSEAIDASTEFFNPAGMIRLDNGQVTGSITDINLDIDAKIKSATSIASLPPIFPAPIVTPVFGANPTKGSTNAVIPSFHFVYPFDHKWAIGFGANAPFGLLTQYADNSIARFLATNSQLTVFDIGPSVAYAFTDAFSVGVGVESEYADISLRQAVPGFGGQNEGFFTNDADNWAWGWHAGALYQYDPNNRLGLTYHSRVNHPLSGDADLNVNLTALGITTMDFPGHVNANLTLPDSVDLSGYHAFNCQWAILGSINYTHWETVQKFTANYSGMLATSPSFSLQSVTIPLNFKDTWRLSTGVDYKPIEKLTLRSGIAYDPTPVPNSTFRTMRLPDGNRFWIALGAQYIINPAFTLDAGYAHIFVKNVSTTNSQTFNTTVNVLGPRTLTLVENAIGDFTSSVDEVGAQLTWNLQSV